MGLTIFAIFVVCSIYVQNRGNERHRKLTRKLTDHANIFAPINCLFYLFSSHPNKPYVRVTHFPELRILEDNWTIIRDEAVALSEAAQIKASFDLDDVGFNSFFRTGWTRFYLKWYGSNLKSAELLCPNTLALISQVPQIKAAMFTMLPPGATLQKHRDPYAGSLRYHLGLVTPNSDDCYISVDGEKYSWRDGEAVMFDETYLHYATNKTDKSRIILFLDFKRPVNFFLVDWLNELFSRLVVAAAATKNVKGDKIGLLNRVFAHFYRVRVFSKRVKSFGGSLYYGLQYTMYLALIYLVFF